MEDSVLTHIDIIFMNYNKLSNIERSYLFLSWILFFHIFRNISLIGYATILLLAYAYIYVKYSHSLLNKRIPISSAIFIITLFWVPLVSTFYLPIDEYITALLRYFVPTLFLLLSCLYQNQYTVSLIRQIMRSMCIFSTLAALSLPYQILFGKISFFADSSMRNGSIRYSSLMGSLTTFGTCGAICVAILAFSGNVLFKWNTKTILIILNVLGLCLTLQKAAIINLVIICFMLVLLSRIKINISSIIKFFIMVVAMLFVSYIVYNYTSLGEYISTSVNYTLGEGNDTENDLISRLWSTPMSVYNKNDMNILSVFLGIGFKALAGTMGLPQYPMNHNNYFDLLFSGGIISLIIVIFLLLKTIISILKKDKNSWTNWDKIYMLSIILILINMFIGAGTFYHPFMAILFSIMAFSYNAVKNIKI